MRISFTFTTMKHPYQKLRPEVKHLMSEEASDKLTEELWDKYDSKLFHEQETMIEYVAHLDLQVFKTDHLKYELETIILEKVLDHLEQAELIESVHKLLELK
ncbi:hypothetical protein [Leptospira phage LE3]|uniref:Uncharacterized protein n=1 Tax=Leptospira phage LE3 TaxID=2041382 RepID=A0A343LE84_9CAUD|nr:hypothetical protein HWB33_gp83 [Leptospira phage LE3]ATN94994.1 hypothetical protein [Leptospira phage LE3]